MRTSLSLIAVGFVVAATSINALRTTETSGRAVEPVACVQRAADIDSAVPTPAEVIERRECDVCGGAAECPLCAGGRRDVSCLFCEPDFNSDSQCPYCLGFGVWCDECRNTRRCLTCAGTGYVEFRTLRQVPKRLAF